MKLTAVNDDNIQNVIVKTSLLYLTVAVFAGMLFISFRFGWSSLAGGLIILINHCWLKSILARVLAGSTDNAVSYAIIRYLLRLFLIATTVVLLFRLDVHIIGLFIGLSILVFSTVSVSIYQLLIQKGEA